ncbi:MAG: DUF2190 family protein [Planctomycetota bacterium]|nr:DUF2190 family protein [Planctomycetota bacterium]
MSQQTEAPVISLEAAEAIGQYLRVKLNSSGKAALAGAGEPAIGISQVAAAQGAQVSVRLLNGPGTFKMVANAAIAALAVVYGVASGKIDDTTGAGNPGHGIGLALEAATAQGDVIEVLPLPSSQGIRIIAGQHTTVAASDTVVTGLAQVFGVVASLDSDPVDDPEWVSASIGDQAGTPAAGSVLIKTWKNTAGNDPTPAAATTFTKKVNWMAWGY